MNTESSPHPSDWHSQVQPLLIQKNYSRATSLYEQWIETAPEVKSHYWYLGLLLLLQGQEAEAQMTWLAAMAEGDEEQIKQWTIDLMQTLETEALRQESLKDYETAWIIRQHGREVIPERVNNVLGLIWLSGTLDRLTGEALEEWGIFQLLSSCTPAVVEFERLMLTCGSVLERLAPDPIGLRFVEACLPHVQASSKFMAVILPAAIKIAYNLRDPALAAEVLECYLKVDPQNVEILGHLAGFYQNVGEFDRGIEVARQRFALVDPLVEKVFSSHLILRGLMTAGGYWQESLQALQQHERLLSALVQQQPTDLQPIHTTRLFTASYFFPYFRDDLRKNRQLQNQVVALCQTNASRESQEQVETYQTRHRSNFYQSKPARPLRIGYLSYCLGRHSVGWLARWLFHYHDRDRVQLYGYFINDRQHDPLYDWYVSQVDRACRTGVDCADTSYALAEQIYQDEIDILVDLDSLTLDISCDVLVLKPAPIQVSWLGWDASGIPAVDYFIADPYVLPDWAQDYYPEKIWRLPQTYIAVDGFEVDVPNLRRDQLNIPADAVVYLSSQKGYKRHADTARLQMRILKHVPNGYFLIKGPADQKTIQQFFTQIAEEEGVSSDRLRFLSETATEAVHRANLEIADVVLDTYPYNGATTTLETLWMGVPLVTRVGEQFAARNSYTMLKNVGVEEGIAWTDEEYVEWGIRLGTDAALRQHVHWKLKASRQTSPLWNAKQFTRDMETAYEQMWAIYNQ